MALAGSSGLRVSVDGKFFRLGERKFFVKGVAYGPFAPNAAGQPFASPEQTAADLAQIRQLGANLVRVYHVPGKWFLDLAGQHELKVLIDIPWNKQLCFLDDPRHRQSARDAVRRAVYACARHPAVFAFSMANEIPPDIVRWSGGAAIANFIDELVLEAKHIDPECLCTFTSYPPTEFLDPQCVDFVCFNVYLHHEQPFKNYLARLQMRAGDKPLLLGEFGIDSLREGEARKCEALRWMIQDTCRSGLAGVVVFSFTDEWFKDGRAVENWSLGLTTADREPKPSFTAVKDMFAAAPYFPLPRCPKVSVIVASYNGDRTLSACLQSLKKLNYPSYEVILVDDGSTDTTPQIAFMNPWVRHLRHEQNLGLSAARNTGIAASTGEIIAFTDSDCRADGDWLYYLVGDLLVSEFAGMGGPNLFPPEDSAVAAGVMASPGGPAHVMLTDRQAEHIPGCNMAFYKWALDEIGGFDPIFRAAGDDVDVCWRLQQAGYKLGFSPSAFVWHYRRSTVPAYLKQQHGYGEAEAMLVRKHPEYFNSLGGSIWRGRIYTSAKSGVLLRSGVIYRGRFGSAGYQALYASEPAPYLMLCTTLEYHLLVTLPLWILSVIFPPLLPLAITSFLISVTVCVLSARQASISRNQTHWWSRPLVALLYFLQPIVRGWARYQGRLLQRSQAAAPQQNLDSVALRDGRTSLREVAYWAERRVERIPFVSDILRHLDQQGWPNKADIGWSDYDMEVYGSRWTNVQVTTVSEDHLGGKQMLRCRLQPRWSLLAKVSFWALFGAEVLVLGLAGSWLALLLPILITLPLFAWFLRRQERNAQSVLIVLLDQIAKDWNLLKVGVNAPDLPKAPASTTGTPSPALEGKV